MTSPNSFLTQTQSLPPKSTTDFAQSPLSTDDSGRDASADDNCGTGHYAIIASDLTINEDSYTAILERNKELEALVAKMEKELEEKNKTIIEMSSFQTNVGTEIEELTSNLFTEAYKMVDVAKSEAAAAISKCKSLEKELEEFRPQDESPRSSHRHGLKRTSRNFNQSTESLQSTQQQQPQISAIEKHSIFSVFKKGFAKKPASSSNGNSLNSSQQVILVDPYLYHEFRSWTKLEEFDQTHPFFMKIKQLDLMPSLAFTGVDISEEAFEVLMAEDVLMEKLEMSQRRDGNRGQERSSTITNGGVHLHPRCALLPDVQGVDYRMCLSKPLPINRSENISLSTNDLSLKPKPDVSVLLISSLARHKIYTVRDLYYFLKRTCMMGQKNNKSSQFIPEYKQLISKRRLVYLARLGFIPPQNTFQINNQPSDDVQNSHVSATNANSQSNPLSASNSGETQL